jgi:hypothetical protein
MKLTPEQEKACQDLKDALMGLPENAASDDIEFEDGFEDGFEDNEPEDLDEDEEGDDEGLELEPEENQARESLVKNAVQRCVLDLLISLFTHLPSGLDDKFYTPIYRFLVLFSLRKDGQWHAGRRITQLFAALLFCGRQVIMALMDQQLTESPHLRYSE